MPRKVAYILESSPDGKRHVCVDADLKEFLIKWLGEDPARLKKFNHIVRLILENLRNTELYDKEDIDSKSKNVTAMKLFKGGQNARIYCKEQKGPPGDFVIIASELLPKKKNQSNTSAERSLIHKVATNEYTIKKD